MAPWQVDGRTPHARTCQDFHDVSQVDMLSPSSVCVNCVTCQFHFRDSVIKSWGLWGPQGTSRDLKGSQGTLNPAILADGFDAKHRKCRGSWWRVPFRASLPQSTVSLVETYPWHYPWHSGTIEGCPQDAVVCTSQNQSQESTV